MHIITIEKSTSIARGAFLKKSVEMNIAMGYFTS